MRQSDREATQRAMLQEVSVKLLLEELWRRLLERADTPFDGDEGMLRFKIGDRIFERRWPPMADDDE